MQDFYRQLEPFLDFRQLSDPTSFQTAPPDWFVVLADIEGSTQAIREGRYKDVNLVGAATITAVLNCCPGTELPYVFGGDGATLLIPPEVLGQVRRALGGVILMAREIYGLALRAGIVPVRDLLSERVAVEVAKWALSPHLCQALFRGGGVSVAEGWVKDPQRGRVYRIEPAADAQADFTGLECRWNPVPAKHGEAASVLVKALGSRSQQAECYQAVLARLDQIYGHQTRPFAAEDLALAKSPRALSREARIHGFRQSLLARLTYRAWLATQVAFGHLLFSSCGPGFWKTYKMDLVQNTDARKFDDMLRMVLEGTTAQHQELRAYLEERRHAAELVFGIHTASDMLVTCLVFNRAGGHFHFVDGNHGGYALAAIELKKQLSAHAQHR